MGWLAVNELKAVVGMLSWLQGRWLKNEVEIEAPVKLILTAAAVLAVVIWELTKKACGEKVKK